MSESTTFRSAYAGGCYRNGEPICVPEPKFFCDEGTWKSGHFLRANSDEGLRPCSTSIETVRIGRCDGSDGFCSNLASRCKDPSSFVEIDETCTIIRDTKKGVLTTYGKCNGRCSWSPDSCLPGETWIPNDPHCTSEYVEVGACFAGFAFCTVSPLNCVDPVKPYLNFLEVREQKGIACFLSDIETTGSPTVTPHPTSTPTQYPTASSTDFDTGNFALESDFPMGGIDTISVGAIVAIIVLGVALGLLVGLGVHYQGRKQDQKEKGRAQPKRPVRVVDAQELSVGSDEDLSIA